jgi:hypothetical protein
MTTRKILNIGLLIVIIGIVIGGGIGLYMFNMPHRDVQSTDTDYSLTSTQIVSEYLKNSHTANEKYLSDDGESKILEITGIVSKISEDFKGQKVVLLKSEMDNAGVSATFTMETSKNASKLKVGDVATIKGVIRSGASYDKDLELYENVILEKSDVVINK